MEIANYIKDFLKVFIFTLPHSLFDDTYLIFDILL